MTTTTRYYKPELDILRLCAFLFVFFVHRLDLAPVDPSSYYWGYHISLVGNYGVPLFFFLSAFLITELLLREQQQFGTINVKAFYLRRILRIWPLYFLFFFSMVLLTHTTPYFDSPIPLSAQAAFSLFSGNWYITFYEWQSYCINPLWSVSVEEQLYILLPLVIFFTRQRGLQIFAWIGLAVSYAVIVYYANTPTAGFSGAWTNSFVQFQFFSAGILTALYLKGNAPGFSLVARVCFFLAGYGCWLFASIVCQVNADSPHLSTIPQSVMGWFAVLLGVLCFFLTFYGSDKKRMPAVLVYLGKISYGMYVFHITIYWIVYHNFKDTLSSVSGKIGLLEWKNEIGAIIAFLITVIIASLSYRFFERPFLRLKKRYTIIPSRD